MPIKRSRYFDISIMDDGGDFHNEEIFYGSIQCEGTGQVVSFKESIAVDEDELPTFIQEIADMVGIEIYFREVTEEVEATQEDNATLVHFTRDDFIDIINDIETKETKNHGYKEDVLIEEIINILCKDNRICLVPPHWDKLWRLIVGIKKGDRINDFELEPIFIFASWSSALKTDKKERFLKHIKWAYTHNRLLKVYRFLMRTEDKYWFKDSNTHNKKTKHMKLLEDEVKKIEYTSEQEEMFKRNAKAEGTSVLLQKIHSKFF